VTTQLKNISLTQVFLIKLFENWGYEGFLQHAEKTATFYEMKRDQCLEAAEKHLKGQDRCFHHQLFHLLCSCTLDNKLYHCHIYLFIVIMKHSDWPQVVGFLRVVQFLPPIQKTATI